MPVPSWTTRVIMAVIFLAVAGDMTRANSCGSFCIVVRPSGSTARVARNGRISAPPLARPLRFNTIGLTGTSAMIFFLLA